MKNILLPILGVLISLSGFAQEKKKRETATVAHDTVKMKKGEALKEVIVTANKQRVPVSAARSGIKIMDLPQSVQIIGSDVIQQQQATKLSDVIRNMNGIYIGSTRGNAQDYILSRGYNLSYMGLGNGGNILRNGFRTSGGALPDVFSLERAEFLKGSSALLYGDVVPGGILNLVTKTPKFTRGGEVSIQMGSYSFYKQPSIDFYGPINKNIAYRFVGTYENSQSFRDVVKNNRYYLNPSFLFKIDDKTNITLQGDYSSQDWIPDFGTGLIGKKFADIPRSKYLGALWSNGKTNQASVSALINHDFNNNWKLSFNSSFQNFHRTSKGTERIQFDNSAYMGTYKDGDVIRKLGQNDNFEQILSEQLSLQGNFYLGKVKNQLFTGIDYENSYNESSDFKFNEAEFKMKKDGSYDPIAYDVINIYNPDLYISQRMNIPDAKRSKLTRQGLNRFGIYLQDLISITDQFKVLAGVRWSSVGTIVKTTDYANSKVTKTTLSEAAFSPKIGLVYQPTTDISVFASYTNSFTPNSGTTVTGDAIKAFIIDQYEIGVKKDWLKGLLSTNLTVYQIVSDNSTQTAEFKADGVTPNKDNNLKVLNGAGTSSKGVEIDITARPIVGLSVMAGYSYNDMRYTKSSGINGSPFSGDRLTRTPAHTANLSFFYTLQNTVLKGLSVGAIGNYTGNIIGGWNDLHDPNKKNSTDGIYRRAIPLKGYTLVDVSLGYTWKNISLLCKLSNVGNVLNYIVHENYSVNPVPPRQIMGTLTYNF